MKKYISSFLCLILLFAALLCAPQPAYAAGAANMYLSSSAQTLYRGDSFTLTVGLSNQEPVSNGGVILSYDSSVFEFIGGSCNVSNAALAEVSAANNGGVFVLQADAVVSGTIFTIRMRVKDDAPFGSYNISGTPSLSIPCSLSGTAVTVACRHTYGTPVNVDGSSHESTCSVCGQKQTEAHSWDNGTVTKAPSCKDTGTKKLTCTGCGTVKEETVPVTDDHTYGNWSQQNASSHSRSCTLCGKTATAAHTWNSGTVLTAATCQKTGSLKQTCTGCGAEKTEVIPTAAHTYAPATAIDEKAHKAACTLCGTELTEAHSFGTREHDAEGHFYRCQSCGAEKDRAAHIPGAEATETTDQLCTQCNRILKPRGAHEHSFEAAWSADEVRHWHTCSGCHTLNSAGAHEYDSGCDTQCNICGWGREPAHTPDTQWASDASGHWHPCTLCGEKLEFAAHIPGEEATVTTAQVCTQCQYELAPKMPHDHVFDSQGTRHHHTCDCGEVFTSTAEDCPICAPFPWWILCLLEAAIFSTVIILLILWMKKRK